MAPLKAKSSGLKVRRCEPELVRPAKPTPRESKPLSDIDDQQDFRFHQQVFQLYKHNPSMQGKDAVKIMRESLAKTLVFYYPFAGRLREGPGRKLIVDCTGEGVMFTEAHADVTILEQFGGDPLCPPFPSSGEFLHNVPGSDGVLNSPLLLVQVTRMRCGGFVVAWRFNHTISDATGFVQFLNAVADMARGLNAPSTLPVWQRHLLDARNPPRITCYHNEYIGVSNNKGSDFSPPLGGMAQRCLLLGSKELATLRRFVPPHLMPCTRFEMVTALFWKSCTVAFQLDPDEVVRMKVAVNARPRFDPPLPKGYYGNVFANPIAVTTAGELVKNPLGYAMELIREAKNKVTEEYMKSTADLMVVKNRPALVQFKNETGPALLHTYNVSDLTRIGFEDVDYGWGKAAYGGPPRGWVGDDPGAAASYLPFKDKAGKDGIMMVVSFPKVVRERFAIAIEELLKDEARCRL